MQISGCFIGVDVGKFELQVADHEGAIVSGSLANSRSSIVGWLKRLPTGSVIAMEATGGYQELLARLAHERGFAVYVLNPTHVHHYAISLGNRGKTDRLDAEVIAQYIAQRHTKLHRYEPVSAELQQVRSLQSLRAAVVRVGASLRLSSQRHGCASGHQEKALASLRAWADALERELIAKVKAHGEWAKTYGLLTGICGIGPINGAALTTLFSRVPFASSDAAVAFCGLDPRPKESGRKVGRRRLSKQGDKAARTLLYNAASSAARTAHFKDYYATLRARGLPSTAALVVIARKLLRIAYGVWRTGQAFDPAKLNFKKLDPHHRISLPPAAAAFGFRRAHRRRPHPLRLRAGLAPLRNEALLRRLPAWGLAGPARDGRAGGRPGHTRWWDVGRGGLRAGGKREGWEDGGFWGAAISLVRGPFCLFARGRFVSLR
ncbi:IS110 family transposase [Achromobacter xylosoxidans]